MYQRAVPCTIALEGDWQPDCLLASWLTGQLQLAHNPP